MKTVKVFYKKYPVEEFFNVLSHRMNADGVQIVMREKTIEIPIDEVARVESSD